MSRKFVTIEVRGVEQRARLFEKPHELTWASQFIVVPVEDRESIPARVAEAVERAVEAIPDEPEPAA